MLRQLYSFLRSSWGAIIVGSLLWLVVRILSSYPELVEQYYSLGLYPWVGKAMRYGLGWIPFSLGDVLYVLGSLMILRWLWRRGRDLIRFRESAIGQLLWSLVIVYAFFLSAWGLNYHRLPLHQSLDIPADYSTEDLVKVTRFFIKESNQLHRQLAINDSLAVVFDSSQRSIFEAAPIAFEQSKNIHPSIASYATSSIKESLITVPLTYLGYSGYLNPITGEAHTNAWINNYKTPVLTLHEMAHQLGFAKENEANFIAIATGRHHPDAYFRYSSTIYGLYYCLRELYKREQTIYKKEIKQVNKGILANYKELQDFWNPYNGIVEDAAHQVYNQYLKANNQPKGIATYSYVVALLVNYYPKQP